MFTVFFLFLLSVGYSKWIGRAESRQSVQDKISKNKQIKDVFYTSARKHGLTVDGSAGSLTARHDQMTFSVFGSAAADEHHFTLCLKVHGGFSGLSFEDRTSAAEGRYQRTGDEDFDEVVALTQLSIGPSFAVLTSQNRKVLTSFAARFCIKLADGTLTVLVPATVEVFTCQFFDARVQEVLDLVSFLTLPSPVQPRLCELVNDDEAPALQPIALQALIENPPEDPTVVPRVCHAVLQSSAPSKLRLWAAIGLGVDGLHVVQSILLSSAPDAVRAVALSHLAGHLDEAALQGLLAAHGHVWLQSTSTAFLNALLPLLSRFPAAGRLEALADHLLRHDLPTYSLILHAITSQPDAQDAVEAALLPHLSRASAENLARFALSLGRWCGPQTAATLKGLIDAEEDALHRNALQQVFAALQLNLSEHGFAGQLALAKDAEVGALSLAQPSAQRSRQRRD